MTTLGIFFIKFYKVILSPLLHQILGVSAACRFEETCSMYAERMIKQYGILYGTQLAIKRLLTCQPFGK